MADVLIDAIIAHARKAAPSECCGLLVGRGQRVDEVVPTANADPSPSRFQVNPQEHFALIRRLRGTGREIVGAYHSHPHSSAVPSPSDLREAWSPELVHLIVSLARTPPDVRAWRIADGRATEMAIVRGNP